MIEPLLCIGAVLAALLAGGLAGYFCGRHDERVTALYRRQMRRRYRMQLKIDGIKLER